MAVAVGTNCRGGGIIIRAKYRPESFRWSVVEVLSFLSNAILAGLGQSTFYTPLTWPFISCEEVNTCSTGENFTMTLCRRGR